MRVSTDFTYNMSYAFMCIYFIYIYHRVTLRCALTGLFFCS